MDTIDESKFDQEFAQLKIYRLIGMLEKDMHNPDLSNREKQAIVCKFSTSLLLILEPPMSLPTTEHLELDHHKKTKEELLNENDFALAKWEITDLQHLARQDHIHTSYRDVVEEVKSEVSNLLPNK